jgi:3-hydroxyacyl-CoA dehydrogenase
LGVQSQTYGNVAVITIDNPPVNGFSYDLRCGLSQELDRAEADTSIVAIVLKGAGKVFSGGADIREFGLPKLRAEPDLLSLIKQIEASRKPIVAAVHGVCLGGGLELALSAHYRVAAPGTDVGLPEVKLGLLPGAGGTQRLPRALGVEPALNMIVTGDSVKSEVLAAIPGQKLFDQIIQGDLLEGACAFAAACAVHHTASGAPLPLVRFLKASHPSPDAYFQFARNTVKAASKNLPAPAKCVDAVEASVKRRFEAGIAFELDLFRELFATPESKAMRHMFFAERAAAKVADISAETPRLVIEKVAVIGAGTMGCGIAMCFLNAGYIVALLETSQDALERGLANIRKIYEGQVQKGKLTWEQRDRNIASLRPTLAYQDIAEVDLVIEAVFEDMTVKAQVFRQLDAVMKSGAILATNTSTLDVDCIADVTERPRDVIGMHFFSPANVMKLLEVVRGKATRPEVLATVMDLAKKIRKTAVVSKVCDGFIGIRMIDQYFRQASFLLEEGCAPEQVDRAIEKFGFAMGPFRMADLAGNDIGWAIRKRRYIEKPHVRYSRIDDVLCEMGRFGQKVGKGFYDYEDGRRDAIPSPIVVKMLAEFRKEAGVELRTIGDDEIVHRLVWALVNEGAHILEEGVASKASDVDVVYLTGYGFPRHRGGPMCYADTVGLYQVVRMMKRFRQNPNGDGGFWEPAPLLARLAAEGKSFT